MSKPQPRLMRRVAFFIGGIVLVYVVYTMASQFFSQPQLPVGSEGSSFAPGEQTPSPTGSVTPTPTPPTTLPAEPADALDNHDEEIIPEVTSPVVSDELYPSEEQIWAYEQAYFTVDPARREELIRPLATEQYLADDLSREPTRFEGIEVNVVIEESRLVDRSVSSNQFTCTVVTSVFLETVRDGETVNRFQGPQHMSAWVNTVDGWRVVTNLGEQ